MKPRLNLLVKSLLLFFFATMLFYLSISNSKLSSRNINGPNIDDTTNTQLTIAVYYETKCPDSAKFFNEQLSSALEIFSDIINVVLIPYGNANYTYNETKKMWMFQCQHGPDECFGNTIHNCLVHLQPKLKDHFPFLNCSMKRLRDLSHDISIECNHLFPIPIDPIMECAKGDLGNKLLYSSALLTDRLNPPKNYIPWIVIDGVHTDDIQTKGENDLVKLICELYKGPLVFEACSNPKPASERKIS